MKIVLYRRGWLLAEKRIPARHKSMTGSKFTAGGSDATLCLALKHASSRGGKGRHLTACADQAQHTEKALVFYYSKAKEDAPSRSLRWLGIAGQKSDRNAIASHLSGNERWACARVTTNDRVKWK
jgi:hypothetical protein